MTRAMVARRARRRCREGWRPSTNTNRDSNKVVDFYRACRQFHRGEVKRIGFVGTVRQLRWALTAAAFSPDPHGPRAA